MLDDIVAVQPHSDLEVQNLVWRHLLHAIRRAMYGLALDAEGGAEARRRAIAILKDVYREWLGAHKTVRHELQRQQALQTPNGMGPPA